MNTGLAVYDGNMLGNNIYDGFLFILTVRNKEYCGRGVPWLLENRKIKSV